VRFEAWMNGSVSWRSAQSTPRRNIRRVFGAWVDALGPS
jgi:hypothetical protein